MTKLKYMSFFVFSLMFTFFILTTNSYALNVIHNVTLNPGTSPCNSGIQGDYNGSHYFIQGVSCAGADVNKINVYDKDFIFKFTSTNNLGFTFLGFNVMNNASGFQQFHGFGSTNAPIQAWQFFSFTNNTLFQLGTTTSNFVNVGGLDNRTALFGGAFDNLEWYILESNSLVRLVKGDGTILDSMTIDTADTDNGFFFDRLAVDNQNRTFVLSFNRIDVYNFTNKQKIGVVNLSLWNLPPSAFSSGAGGSIFVNNTPNALLWLTQTECSTTCGQPGNIFPKRIYSINYTDGLFYQNQTDFLIIQPQNNEIFTNNFVNFVARIKPTLNGTLRWYLNNTNIVNTTYNNAPNQNEVSATSGQLTEGLYSLSCDYRDTNNNIFSCSNIVNFEIKTDFGSQIGEILGNALGVSNQQGLEIFAMFLAFSISLAVAFSVAHVGGGGVAQLFITSFLGFVLVFTFIGWINIVLSIVFIIIAGFILVRLMSNIFTG